MQSSFLLALAALVAPPHPVRGVSFGPVTGGGPHKIRLQTDLRALERPPWRSLSRRKHYHFTLFGGVFQTDVRTFCRFSVVFASIPWAVLVVLGALAGAVFSIPRAYVLRAEIATYPSLLTARSTCYAEIETYLPLLTARSTCSASRRIRSLPWNK